MLGVQLIAHKAISARPPTGTFVVLHEDLDRMRI